MGRGVKARHGGGTWGVFGPEGAWRAEVTLPARFVSFEFGREHVAGVAFDDDDVERVVIWRLQRAPRGTTRP